MVVFVGDPGVDDAVAIGVLAEHGVDLELVVATAGNVDVEPAATVAARLAGALGLRCPVRAARGSRLVRRPHREGRDLKVHGDDGLGGQVDRLPSAPEAADLRHDGLAGAEVFACGPLTVVAEALDAGTVPTRITWMGGGLEGGNTTVAAEFNAWCDPEAVDQVLTSGVPVDVVPLDVTTRVHLGAVDLDRWRGSLVGSVLADAYGAMIGRGEPVPHDAVAAVAWLQPELFEWSSRPLRCDTTGTATRGALLSGDPSATSATRVAVDLDVAEVHRRIVDAIAALR
jgi:inosine-uridine nucleoside N-ribohydrolase